MSIMTIICQTPRRGQLTNRAMAFRLTPPSTEAMLDGYDGRRGLSGRGFGTAVEDEVPEKKSKVLDLESSGTSCGVFPSPVSGLGTKTCDCQTRTEHSLPAVLTCLYE